MAVRLKASFHFWLSGGRGSGGSDKELAPPPLGVTATVVTTVLSVVTAARQGVAGLVDKTPTHCYNDDGGKWGRHR
ncbi:hypothetical protein E2562_032961 [Oryza meyeriana var. granulata]|uniref:Uncharacterized protein n=1 Tax=Oryza meyeriana var. granulata TaxID=110450 RepID=A0A6G1DA28_9ORYZ|nr:hypothetical protein E2562_032961 [Oryza meyeriana var. granulata]